MINILTYVFAVCPIIFSLETAQKPYSSIDTKASERICKTLLNESLPLQERQDLCRKIEKNPGNYNPNSLHAAGIFLLSQKQFHQAAQLCVAAEGRAFIDSKISMDDSTSEVFEMFQLKTVKKANGCLSDQEYKQWNAIFQQSKKQFIKWDQSTPRNYDVNWVRLNGINVFADETFKETDPSNKQSIIECCYRQLTDTLSEEDYAKASMNDKCYFDRKNSIFYHNGLNISFQLPSCIQPYFSATEGCYTSSFNLIGTSEKDEFYIEYSWSITQPTFEELYQKALSECASGQSIEKIIIGNGIHCYKTQKIDAGIVCTCYNFISGQYQVSLALYSTPESVNDRLQSFKTIQDSVKLIN